MKKTTIIFDLDGVLFKAYKTGLAKAIGIRNLAHYAMRNWKNPEAACFDTLAQISKQEEHPHNPPLIHKGRIMPNSIVQWQLGKISQKQLRKQLAQQIDQLGTQNFFANERERNLVKKILDTSLDPKNLIKITKPIKSMINLAKKLKKHGYTLFILSNLADDAYQTLVTSYPEFANLFDDIIISAHINTFKPHKQMYTYLLDTYNIKSDECVFIDNQEENIKAAQNMGIDGIAYTSTRDTKEQLRKFNVIF